MLPGLLRGLALELCAVEGHFLDQNALSFVPLPGQAESHDHRGEPAGLFGTPAKGGISSGQEDQVIHLRARHAHRTRILHQ